MGFTGTANYPEKPDTRGKASKCDSDEILVRVATTLFGKHFRGMLSRRNFSFWAMWQDGPGLKPQTRPASSLGTARRGPMGVVPAEKLRLRAGPSCWSAVAPGGSPAGGFASRPALSWWRPSGHRPGRETPPPCPRSQCCSESPLGEPAGSSAPPRSRSLAVAPLPEGLQDCLLLGAAQRTLRWNSWQGGSASGAANRCPTWDASLPCGAARRPSGLACRTAAASVLLGGSLPGSAYRAAYLCSVVLLGDLLLGSPTG